jgi:hypothetical protein
VKLGQMYCQIRRLLAQRKLNAKIYVFTIAAGYLILRP